MEPGQVWVVDIGCARSNLQCIGQRAKNNPHVARINNGMSGRASIHCLDVIRMRVGVLFLSWRLLLLRSSFSMRHAASLIYPVPRGNRTRHMGGHTDFREIADHTRVVQCDQTRSPCDFVDAVLVTKDVGTSKAVVSFGRAMPCHHPVPRGTSYGPRRWETVCGTAVCCPRQSAPPTV